MKWNALIYDTHHDFVAEYGKGLLELIPLNQEQRILDLGCGTGTLTKQLTNYGNVLGVDGSASMIAQAKKRYPEVVFQVMDALQLPFENEWEVIFSNAVFHWINNHQQLLSSIYQALVPEGQLICEFGAYGNIQVIEESFQLALEKRNCAYQSKFTFPKIADFAKLLENQGFIIDAIVDYDRPTVLSGGEQGLAIWGKQFFETELAVFSEVEQEQILTDFVETAHEKLWQESDWIADYRRLRVVAHK
ncbi:hypothetical protein DOK78_001251 [Enterococcus sp. DIV2402]|uniref:Methyltransferase type 11 domain-containing protein n=1 Tax=Candidatus Enterococcus lowellii TaxID=2230877 RepID=A0ABZ2SLA6_9ENTE|nr:class I SAM-dependent methyltransferase [Enterococcus sp. DIV2402]MBO0464552.1 methyltransferase domain-containing protein [Enterococcus sp. DIV2402]